MLCFFSFRVAIHREIVNVQVEMLRQFQIQQVSCDQLLNSLNVAIANSCR